MSIQLEMKVRELERRVKDLESLIARMITDHAKMNAAPVECVVSPPDLDRRTREYREWKNANSARS